MNLTNMINQQLSALLKNESNWLAQFSNSSALLMENLENINWAGFYFYDIKTDELILGPFQGKVACVRITNGRGACGTSFKEKRYNVLSMSINFQVISLATLPVVLKSLFLYIKIIIVLAF